MTIKDILHLLEGCIGNPSEGLPEDVFLFASTIVPMVNVDLLIKDEKGRTLLTWRDDGLHAPGWHIPGGIIRYKELASHRIREVAARELGAEVRVGEGPLAINEVIEPGRKVRGHFISLLYQCTLAGPADEGLRCRSGAPRPGEWAWHGTCPENLIAVHDMYRKFMS